jgi:hypothetical protein
MGGGPEFGTSLCNVGANWQHCSDSKILPLAAFRYRR